MSYANLKKLNFKEINHRWLEFKELSKKALNDERNPTNLKDQFEVAMARFLLLCETGVGQVWISSENDKECYLIFSFISKSLMTQEQGFTFYSAVKFDKALVSNKQSHWYVVLQEVYQFAKSKTCKRIYLEADIDYWEDLFKQTPMPYKYQIRNALSVEL